MVPKKIFTQKQIADIIRRYTRKEPLKSIGIEYGVSQGVITRILREKGVKIRITTFQKAFTEEQEKVIVEKYKNGMSALEIIKELKTSYRIVSRVLKAAGYNLRQASGERRRKLNDNQIFDIARKYLDGKSQVELAKEYNVSNPTIASALSEQNIELRTISEAMGGLSYEQKMEVARMYEDGLNTVEISKKFGVENGTIGRYLNELNVSRRSDAEVYGGFSFEQEDDVINKYLSGMTSVEIAEEYGKDYKSVLRLIEKRGLEKRTAGQSRKLKTERDLDVEDICNRYKRGESSISIGNDCNLTYATIVRILEDNDVEIRESGNNGDSVMHAIKKTGNFLVNRETEFYVYTIIGQDGLLKPGITFDEKTRKKSSGGRYGNKMLSIVYPSRTEAYFLEKAVLRETKAYWDAPEELIESNWQGCYELRRMDFHLLEKVIVFYQEILEEIGVWEFASNYIPMTEAERLECTRIEKS